MRPLKLFVYRLCKAAGLFAVARRLTRRGLRILCYHGFSLADEDEFRPGLFIRARTFERRMRMLADQRYPVIPLQQAAAGLAAGRLPPNAVVITIDDGFYGVSRIAAPILERRQFPATVYVTSYYAAKQTPIFRLAIQYLFWKTAAASVSLSGLGLPPRLAQLSLGDARTKERGMWEIIEFGENELDEPRRAALAESLAGRLGLDYETLRTSRRLALMTTDELRRLPASGVDLQLHTHRHRLPENEGLVTREILQNREFLSPLGQRQLHHFCYPSGIWSERHWPWLAAMGVETATTCDPGLNYPETPRLGLRRFLDGEDISQIEFEAEVSGFSEILRRLRALLTRAGHHRSTPSHQSGTLGAAA